MYSKHYVSFAHLSCSIYCIYSHSCHGLHILLKLVLKSLPATAKHYVNTFTQVPSVSRQHPICLCLSVRRSILSTLGKVLHWPRKQSTLSCCCYIHKALLNIEAEYTNKQVMDTDTQTRLQQG